MTILEIESTLTDRYQTTVPDAVRRALKLSKRDRIVYRVDEDGTVVMARKADDREDDPVVGRFLDFLASDMAEHPGRLVALDAALARRIQPLVEDVDVDLDAPLRPEDE